MMPAKQYRMCQNLLDKRGVHVIEEFARMLNEDKPMELIARQLLHVSTSRAYRLRDALFRRVWGLTEPAAQAVNNTAEEKEVQAELAREIVKTSHLRLIECKRAGFGK